MGMLTAYADASGTDGYSSIVTIAGYVSDVNSWEAFRVEWNEYRSNNGIDVFHATDMASNRRAFSSKNGWTKNRCLSALRIADNIIAKHTMQAFVGYTTIAECKELIPHKDSKLGSRRPFSMEYVIAGMGFIKVLKKWASAQHHKEPIRLVFEKGDQGKGYLQYLLDWIRANDDENGVIGEHSFEDKKEFVQLHAADRIANMACRGINEFRRGGNRFDPKVARKLRLDNCHTSILDEENWSEMKARVQPIIDQVYEKPS